MVQLAIFALLPKLLHSCGWASVVLSPTNQNASWWIIHFLFLTLFVRANCKLYGWFWFCHHNFTKHISQMWSNPGEQHVVLIQYQAQRLCCFLFFFFGFWRPINLAITSFLFCGLLLPKWRNSWQDKSKNMQLICLLVFVSHFSTVWYWGQ